MGDGDKIYPQDGIIEVGMYHFKVRFFSEKDEHDTRTAVKAIKRRLKELADGYDDSESECCAILALQLMIENNELKAQLEHSSEKETIESIDNLLDSVNDEFEGR